MERVGFDEIYIYIYLEKEETGVKRRTLIPPKFSHYFQGRDIGPSSVGDTGGVEVWESFASFNSVPVVGLMGFKSRNQGELNIIFFICRCPFLFIVNHDTSKFRSLFLVIALILKQRIPCNS